MTLLLTVFFAVGYAAIAFEHNLKINKAAAALLTGVACWTTYILGAGEAHEVLKQLDEHLGGIAGILFFLLGAMVIVELVDAHDGFSVITQRIHTTDKRKLLWIIGWLSFFLSSVLDNLTTTIVMVSLVKKLIDNHDDRLLFAGIIVIAANAGGAWTPIGDVTTTMLWIGGQITAFSIMESLFLPSVICLLLPLLALSVTMRGKVSPPALPAEETAQVTPERDRNILFFMGLGALLFVPIFKTLTHLPPVMGILLGLGVLWVVSEMLNGEKDEFTRHQRSVQAALQRVDASSVLFFLGILLAIAALESAGLLHAAAEWLNRTIGNNTLIVLLIGFLSAIVDNVPLVAATQGMYPLSQYPPDDYIWEFLAYCAGTGGSILIIGSAAGVAAMGLEKINFMWYLKRIAALATLGYLGGAAVYVAERAWLHLL